MKRFQHTNGSISYYKNTIAERMEKKKEGRIVKWKKPGPEIEQPEVAETKSDKKGDRDKK